jgi:putative FmdB family regulatory protein
MAAGDAGSCISSEARRIRHFGFVATAAVRKVAGPLRKDGRTRYNVRSIFFSNQTLCRMGARTCARRIMPIYEYRCNECGHEVEALQKLSDAPLVTCPACAKPALQKLVSAAGFQLKGSGWYVTDFRGGAGSKKPDKPDAPAADAAKSETKGESTARSESATKSEPATPAAPATSTTSSNSSEG